MSDNGYVQILHELLRSDLVLNAPIAYRWVLITIIDRVAFSECIMDDHGKKIIIKPNEFLSTYREIAALANVEKNDAERAVKYFHEIVRHEVRHRKSVFTILWGIKERSSETITETKVRQERDIKQEEQDFKILKEQQPQTPCSVAVFSCLENFVCDGLTQKEKKNITQKYHDREKIIIDAVASVSDPDFIPSETSLKSLRAAIKGEWKPKQSGALNIEKNRDLALRLEKYKHPYYQFVASTNVLEIIKSVATPPAIIMYQMPEDRFIQEIEKQAKINLKEIFTKKGVA